MAKKSFIIGRAGHIALYDDTVSRRHARLDIDGDRYFLTDLDSRNGTYEIREKQLVPFSSGEVTIDQVFAFGECVRNMGQLLANVASLVAAQPAQESGVEPSVPPANAASHDTTSASVPPVQRLSPTDIVNLLERAEDMLEDGVTLTEVCDTLGISDQRYQRWCREYGATRLERQGSTQALRRENERLRKLVSDLSLERDALREALELARSRVRGEGVLPPNLSVVVVGDGKGKG